MKKITILLISLLMLSVGLVAQTNPRTLYVRLVNQDGSSLTNDITGITFQARLMKPNAGELNQSSPDCGFYFAGGNLYARVQLGNFNLVNWAAGDRVEMDVQRASDNSVGSDHNIIIPDATGIAIWWGRPPSGTTTYPGSPIYLIPQVTSYTLTVTSDPSGKPIYKDNVDTEQVTPYF